MRSNPELYVNVIIAYDAEPKPDPPVPMEIQGKPFEGLCEDSKCFIKGLFFALLISLPFWTTVFLIVT